MLGTTLRLARNLRRSAQLPLRAKLAYFRDRLGLPEHDPGNEHVISEAIAWLGRAQDNANPRDGGVARHFSLETGSWSASYPETTGYIVPTLIQYAKLRNDADVRDRAKRMLDWLVSIQYPSGAFQGGLVNASPRVPVTFNTGQILLGLASGVEAFGAIYREPMRRAADWLATTQDSDGCWRRYATPFAQPGEKAYETHVAWGLFEAARVERDDRYAEVARANIRWALTHQQDNGWFANCCLNDPAQPLTHTLGYALRGLVEAYRFSPDPALLAACRKTADGLLGALRDDGSLAGRLRPDWTPAVDWVCLTGNAQISICWLLLYRATGDDRYREGAYRANRYVRRTVDVDGPDGVRGGVKGSFPVSGSYGAYEYLNWAAKFLVDSLLLENSVRATEGDGLSAPRRLAA
jgi:hypothetical protein